MGFLSRTRPTLALNPRRSFHGVSDGLLRSLVPTTLHPSLRHLRYYSASLATDPPLQGLKISERAITRLKEVDPHPILRVAVDSGGCNGYQYVLELVKTTEDEDMYVCSVLDS